MDLTGPAHNLLSQCIQESLGYLLYRLRPVDFNQFSAVTIIGKQRCGLIHIYLDAMDDRFSLIVITLVKFGAIQIAFSGFLRRIEPLMKNMSVHTPGPATTQSFHKHFLGSGDERNNIHLSVEIVQDVFECIRLGRGAGKTIDNGTRFTVWKMEAISDHANRHIVRHQISFGNECMSQFSQISLIFNVLSKQVSGRNMSETGLLG